MFTGLIQFVLPVLRVTSAAGGARIVVDFGPHAERIGRGDSIAFNGVCLTVAQKAGTVCEFDAVAETLSRTTLGRLRPGERLNVELALRVGDALGGHFVMGHVDGVGTVAELDRGAVAPVLRVKVDAGVAGQLAAKGSVAVDGVSLTVVDAGADFFTCAVIPTTLKDTTLGTRRPGDAVNVETDVLGKYVVRHLAGGAKKTDGKGGLTMDKLGEAGFV